MAWNRGSEVQTEANLCHIFCRKESGDRQATTILSIRLINYLKQHNKPITALKKNTIIWIVIRSQALHFIIMFNILTVILNQLLRFPSLPLPPPPLDPWFLWPPYSPPFPPPLPPLRLRSSRRFDGRPYGLLKEIWIISIWLWQI